MAVSLREYRARIKSTESMKKITRAMELIAASRIIKAQQRAQAAAPYARELTRAVSAVATYSNVDHALTTEPEDPKRAAILVITSDRGLAGAYSSSVLKEAERLRTRLEDSGLEVVDIENLRRHYAHTLDAWAERFDRNWERIHALNPAKFNERFRRIWRTYLVSCAEMFRSPIERTHLFQIVFSKGNITNRSYPMSRGFLYPERGEAAR